jgi:hypothetical protein
MLSQPTRRAVASSLAVLLTVLPAVVLADGRFAKARLLVPKDDGKAQEVEGALTSDTKAKRVRFDTGGRVAFEVPYDAIKSILYEKAAKPRYGAGLLLAWPLLFTKSKKHFVTIQYTDASGQGKFEIVRLDKGNFTIALATLEADTGIKIERTEER